jgi:hypothetical protein
MDFIYLHKTEQRNVVTGLSGAEKGLRGKDGGDG